MPNETHPSNLKSSKVGLTEEAIKPLDLAAKFCHAKSEAIKDIAEDFIKKHQVKELNYAANEARYINALYNEVAEFFGLEKIRGNCARSASFSPTFLFSFKDALNLQMSDALILKRFLQDNPPPVNPDRNALAVFFEALGFSGDIDVLTEKLYDLPDTDSHDFKYRAKKNILLQYEWLIINLFLENKTITKDNWIIEIGGKDIVRLSDKSFAIREADCIRYFRDQDKDFMFDHCQLLLKLSKADPGAILIAPTVSAMTAIAFLRAANEISKYLQIHFAKAIDRCLLASRKPLTEEAVNAVVLMLLEEFCKYSNDGFAHDEKSITSLVLFIRRCVRNQYNDLVVTRLVEHLAKMHLSANRNDQDLEHSSAPHRSCPKQKLMAAYQGLFFDACEAGLVKIIKPLLEMGVDINHVCTDRGCITPLHAAAIHGQDKVVAQLIKAEEIEVNMHYNGLTALLSAVMEGHDKVVEQLLEAKKIDINSAKNNGVTPLFIAVLLGHKRIVEIILNKIRGNYNQSRLFDFVTETSYIMRPSKMSTCMLLNRARKIGKEKELKTLLQEKLNDANLPSVISGLSPLHAAIVFGHEDIFDLIKSRIHLSRWQSQCIISISELRDVFWGNENSSDLSPLGSFSSSSDFI